MTNCFTNFNRQTFHSTNLIKTPRNYFACKWLQLDDLDLTADWLSSNIQQTLSSLGLRNVDSIDDDQLKYSHVTTTSNA